MASHGKPELQAIELGMELRIAQSFTGGREGQSQALELQRGAPIVASLLGDGKPRLVWSSTAQRLSSQTRSLEAYWDTGFVYSLLARAGRDTSCGNLASPDPLLFGVNGQWHVGRGSALDGRSIWDLVQRPRQAWVTYACMLCNLRALANGSGRSVGIVSMYGTHALAM
ncbi:hypothetical protein CFIMG_002793RA [Ceratocystis fimbriata CBS 114723]|uniref:Uncharacterized protein n=1 Tax=Ceratocystis fimbriata CBS 114723 TaxID=1035309 RepID=A0A2C5X483_9PEZI|nr:hypothetical protein CFIMG_002793RA [Ceratocystis fimbriata CBS 114723]